MEPRMLKDLLAGLTYTVAENCSITEEVLDEMEIPAVICDDRKLQAGLDSVVMEISTIGLQFHRSQGMIFDFGIFTNIGHDHIGPGGAEDFDHLIEYKGRLLRQCRTGLVNIDDPNIDRVLEGHTCTLKTFGLSEKADYRAEGIVYEVIDGRPGVSFDVPCADLHVNVSMPGEFTVYNSLAAIGTVLPLGAPEEAILSTLREFSLPGRFQIVTQKKSRR